MHHFHAAVDSIDRFFDQILGGLGCLVRLGRQIAHLICDHSKPFTCNARARSFHCGVQRKDIGLECDVFDRRNDLADLL